MQHLLKNAPRHAFVFCCAVCCAQTVLSKCTSLCVGLQELSTCPNVYAKVSGMFHTDPNWNQKSFEEVAKPVLEIFGIDR